MTPSLMTPLSSSSWPLPSFVSFAAQFGTQCQAVHIETVWSFVRGWIMLVSDGGFLLPKYLFLAPCDALTF